MADPGFSASGEAPIPLRGHIPGLDGARGVAILLVMLHHLTVMDPIGMVDRVFEEVMHTGWCGVDLFFVLSGFLITGILYDAKGSDHFFRNFYLRRTVRIFPLYYAIVFLALILVPWIGATLDHPIVQEKMNNFGRIDGSEAWYWLYLSNFSIAAHNAFRHGILDISWSLAIEEQFYLVWPTVVFLLARRPMLRVCAGLVAFALIFRTAMVAAGAGSITVYVLTPSRLDALAIGAMLSLLARAREDRGGLRTLVPAARWMITLGALIVIPTIIADLILTPDRYSSSMGRLMQTYGYTALATGFGGFLVLAMCAPATSAFGRIMNGRFLCMLGKYSYAIYLFHLPLRAMLRDLVPFFGPGGMPVIAGSRIPVQIVFFVVSTVLTVGVAWLSWHLYEKQFLRLKRFFPYGKKTTQAWGNPTGIVETAEAPRAPGSHPTA